MNVFFEIAIIVIFREEFDKKEKNEKYYHLNEILILAIFFGKIQLIDSLIGKYFDSSFAVLN